MRKSAIFLNHSQNHKNSVTTVGVCFSNQQELKWTLKKSVKVAGPHLQVTRRGDYVPPV